jgi:hypothetical protein
MAEILEKEVTYETTDVTLITTAETVASVTPSVKIPVVTCRAVIRGFAQVLGGTGTTTINPRIRRGTLVTDPLVGDANAVSQPVLGTGSGLYFICVSEQLQNRESVQYALTIEAGGASGNGTVRSSMVEVEIING